LLDNTLILWTNELGKGNSHTLDNIPFVLVGNGLDFRMGRSLRYPNVPHNRLLLALALFTATVLWLHWRLLLHHASPVPQAAAQRQTDSPKILH